MQHKRLAVDKAGVGQPYERGVKHLKHPVVVLRHALLLEAAVYVDVRLLVVATVDEDELWVLELEGEDEQDDLAGVVAAVHEVAVEDPCQLLARLPEGLEQVKQVVLRVGLGLGQLLPERKK